MNQDSEENRPDQNTEIVPSGGNAKTAPAETEKRSGAYYYGKPSYGLSPYYSNYGQSGYYYGQGGNSSGYYYGSPNNSNEEEDSIFGPVTLHRIIRVTLLKWPTLIVSVVLGLMAGFAYYKLSPVVYKAQSMIELSVKPTKILNTTEVLINDPNAQGTTQEIFSTRLAMLQSMKVVKLVADRVRSDSSVLKTMSDDDLYHMLKDNVDFDIQKQSRLVLISVKHGDPEIAKLVANAYAETAVAFSKDENKDAAEAGVDLLKTMHESHTRAVNEATRTILEFREKNQLDPMISEAQSLSQAFGQLSLDKIKADTDLTADEELLAILTSIQQDPTKFSSIPANTPRASEISEAQKELQNARSERDSLFAGGYTAKHPEYLRLSRRVEVYEKQYSEAIFRARETAAANRELSARKVLNLERMIQQNSEHRKSIETKITQTESQLKQLEFALANAEESLQAISRRMEETRLSISDQLATVRIIEYALLPKQQFSPDARIAFSVGALLGLIVGFLFILALDHIEDRITGSEDITRHMNTTILNLVPRIPRTKRTELALLSATKKFSRIAEAFAGLRGVLESPRYANVSKVVLVVSTQPEEGKTITASNLALTFAQSGKKTLLVDFDLRRPRIARIYKVTDKIESKNNLIEVLSSGEGANFDNIAIPSEFPNLDLVVSAVSGSLSPANAIGSDNLRLFFDWARANYENVVIDSPPFGLVSDAIRLGAFSDSVMIVCRPNKSRFALVRHALTSLRSSGSNVIGIVVNEVNFSQAGAFSSGSYGSYSMYGNRYSQYNSRYGYGSYYKRSVGDDITVKRISASSKSENKGERETSGDLEFDEE